MAMLLAVMPTGCALEDDEDDASIEEEPVASIEQDVRYPQKCWDVSGWDLVPPCYEWTGAPPDGKIRVNFANDYESIRLQRCTTKKRVDCSWTTVARTYNNAVKTGWVTITKKGPSWWRMCVQKYPGSKWKCAGSFDDVYFAGE